MSPYWMLNIFICAIHFTHALVLKAPQSPTMLGDTLKIIWHSEPGDPPFFDLDALCAGVDPLRLLEARTNSSQAVVTIDDSKIQLKSPNSSVSCILRARNVTDGAVFSTSPPFDVISPVSNATQPLMSTSLPPMTVSESDPSSSIPGLNLIPSQIGALPAQTVITANLTSTKNVGTAKATLSLPASISGTPPTTTQAILPSSDTFTPSSTTTQASSETPNVSRNNGGPLGVGVRRMTPLVTLSVVLLLLLDI